VVGVSIKESANSDILILSLNANETHSRSIFSD
jgi:hypothetical protein